MSRCLQKSSLWTANAEQGATSVYSAAQRVPFRADEIGLTQFVSPPPGRAGGDAFQIAADVW